MYRNISVICLFRKFSYQKKGDRIYTVYGPQIIGRGLRRIRPPSERDALFVTDHPAFNHGWLWELLSAQEYAKPLNPGDEVDAQAIDDLPLERPVATDEEVEPKPEKLLLDIEALIDALPDAGQAIEPVADWQQYFKNLEFKTPFSSAMQNITNIKHQKLGSDLTAHELPDGNLNFEELNETDAELSNNLEHKKLWDWLESELNTEPRHALMACFKMETAEEIVMLRAALEWIVEARFSISLAC